MKESADFKLRLFPWLCIFHRSAGVTIEHIRELVSAQGLGKVKALLRNHELPINHGSRGELWVLLSSGASDRKTDDKAFEIYAEKFAHGK